jgi:uncharacterized protein (TIGR03437 family)
MFQNAISRALSGLRSPVTLKTLRFGRSIASCIVLSMRSLLLTLTFSLILPAQPTLQFPGNLRIQPFRILLKGSGSVVVGSGARGSNPGGTVQTNSFGSNYGTLEITLEKPSDAPRSGIDTPLDAAFDSAGNLWIVGSTTSDDFSLVNPIVADKAPYRQSGFVVEIDSTGSTVKFASYLGGHAACEYSCGSYASTITADNAGNVYVGGATDEPDFPTTPGAFLTSGPQTNYYYSFVIKISASGSLVYSTYLGTGDQKCLPPAFNCPSGLTVASRPDSLAVDSTGQVTAAESMSEGPGRITRLSGDGSKAIWRTDTGITVGGILRLLLAQDSTGAVTLFGASAPLDEPIDARSGNGPGTLFIEKLSSGGTVTATLNLGSASADAQPSGIALDASGNIWVDGTDSSTAGALSGGSGVGSDFLLEIDPALTNPLNLIRFFRGIVAAGLAIDSQQDKLIPGPNSALLTIPAQYTASTPMLEGFTNAASYAVNTGAYPGALVSLIGLGFHGAPETVTIAGVAAPVLYAGPNQINVQIPFEADSGRVDLTLPAEGITIQLPITQSLGIFTTDGVHAAAVNQDGTVNSAANPAAMGSFVTLYATGAVWPFGMADGAIPTAAAWLNQEQNGFQVADLPTGIPQDILYAGVAPEIIDGVFQINLAVPSGVVISPSLGWQVLLQSILKSSAAPLSSNTVGIYVH